MKSTAISRRAFLSSGALLAGSVVLAASPLKKWPCIDEAPSVGQIIDTFIAQVPSGTIPHTIDTLKSGSRDTKVTGVVTTMFATIDVIRKAIELKSNFIIAHEPAFYNHLDDVNWLQQDDVYRYKKELLEKNSIAIWRNHDYIHSLHPDGVSKGLIDTLGWQQFGVEGQPVFNLPAAQRLGELIAFYKKKLGIPALRYVGDLKQHCQKILLLPGAYGGKAQIEAIGKYKPDVLVCGEIAEWETAEYVRDARAKGDKLSLVVLGHIASEEPGSVFMVDWLKQHFPQVKATHVHPGNSLSFA
ncbi:Nif3-like dinuclear metal center hexameric protein [Chitinophaga qingshengii]|uniref:Nif3-like dinuclear metal center hexameric protein n=1 Tax=Chitinophaga qingshengii TaxID=1569794 RepID=A0ABR7TPU4_9BACT|nr:Nif3-like dinuclear metal center hexameric protein [Chitinophaga qingshengii]MBC9931998.1 Nif3-like dinuclear metal center hexameric protein [Chitinophaga qingshengii]